MVYGAQYSAVRPMGIKRKKNRFSPIVQEQARQGLATKMVTQKKDQDLVKEQWDFEKQTRERELGLQQQQLDMAEEQADFQKKMGWAELGLGGISTALEVMDFFDLF